MWYMDASYKTSALSAPAVESFHVDLYLILHIADVCCYSRLLCQLWTSIWFGGAIHQLYTCVNCLNLLTCWKPSKFHCTFLQWVCGLGLRLQTAMGRADMAVIWKDLVLQSKPLLAGCSTGHHTLWVCNLSLVNLTQDMPTHTWNPLNAFLFKIHFMLCNLCQEAGRGGGIDYGDLRSWFSQHCKVFITEHHAGAEHGNLRFLLQYMALDCVTVRKGHWNSTCPPFIDL